MGNKSSTLASDTSRPMLRFGKWARKKSGGGNLPDATTGYVYPQAIKSIRAMESVKNYNKYRRGAALSCTALGLLLEGAIVWAVLMSPKVSMDIITIATGVGGMIVLLEILFLVVFYGLTLSNVRSDPNRLTYALECKAYLQSAGYSEDRLKIASDMADHDRKIIQTRHIVTGVALALLLAFAGTAFNEFDELITRAVRLMVVALAFVLVIGRYAFDAEQERADVVLQQAVSLCSEDIIREKEEADANVRLDQSQSRSTTRSGWM